MLPGALRQRMAYSVQTAAALLPDTEDCRLLLYGESGTGKSTLALELAKIFSRAGQPCFCLSADPGSPSFGIPGTVGLARWTAAGWQTGPYEALCSLNAGRFRLPLVLAVRKLVALHTEGVLLVDAPGVVRGVAGAELLTSLAHAAAVDMVLVLVRPEKAIPLVNELRALSVPAYCMDAAAESSLPGKKSRACQRQRLWDDYLSDSISEVISHAALQLVGMPPPVTAPEQWPGRQIAFLDDSGVLLMGEVVQINHDTLLVRVPENVPPDTRQLLVRDARRDEKGHLATSQPFTARSVNDAPPPDIKPDVQVFSSTGPRPVVHIGPAVAMLVNGVLGDPLLHLRLRSQKRSMLFDLGEGSRLPAKIAHQVTDVFISHGHIDHISGFFWFLRSRIGDFPPCRIFGPPGVAALIAAQMNGILWDRVGTLGPCFDIGELHGASLHWYRVQAGIATTTSHYRKQSVEQKVIWQEPTFCVRAVTLDHGTPVLAYAFELSPRLTIRRDRLAAMGLSSGAWLQQLKYHAQQGNREVLLELPDGGSMAVGKLADALIRASGEEKLVYATDLADSPTNRKKLIEFTGGAHTFFCEAAFCQHHASQAVQTFHLTARACGEIANAAGVKRLLPFHFSKRYSSDLQAVYDEIRIVCPNAVTSGYAEKLKKI